MQIIISMKRIKLLVSTISIFLTLNVHSQVSTILGFNYMTDNNETMNWGFTLHPEYHISHHWRVGLSTTFFINPNPFPDYLALADQWNSPNIIAGSAHRVLPIDATIKYYFNNKAKQKLQPHIQINTGVAILGTFTKAAIKNLSYIKYNHETDNYLSLGFKVGTDYSILKNLDLNINAGYTRVFSDSKNRFANAPVDLTNYNSYFNHYFIFVGGLKYNFN
jgi:outer membrane protein W